MNFESENNTPDAKPKLRMTREIPFVKDQEVIMKRTGRNGEADWFQAGWKVETFDEETGEYIVTFDDKESGVVIEKPVSPAELTSYQPDAMVDKPGTTELSYETSDFAPRPTHSVDELQAEARTPEPQPIIDRVPDFADVARSIVDIEGSSELHERASEDLGKEATEEVVKEPS